MNLIKIGELHGVPGDRDVPKGGIARARIH